MFDFYFPTNIILALQLLLPVPPELNITAKPMKVKFERILMANLN
jgi:hypothetical protein